MANSKKKVRQTAMYQKEMVLRLTGSNVDEIQEVARAIHALNHPHVIGGKEKRKVTITSVTKANPPQKIFDGLA